MIRFNNYTEKAIHFNGFDIVKARYNGNVVFEKSSGPVIISGRMCSTVLGAPCIKMNGFTDVLADLDGTNWSLDITSYMPLTSTKEMFRYDDNTEQYRNEDLYHIVLPQNFDTSHVTNFQKMFYGLPNLYSIDFGGMSTESATSLLYMFCNSPCLTSFDIGGWDTSNVETMDSMFRGSRQLSSIDISAWNTSNLMYTSYMFFGCSELESLDIRNWNTQNLRSMAFMFANCSALRSFDISNWNTSLVNEISSLFRNCESLVSLALSQIGDGTYPVNTSYAFKNCSNLRYITFSGKIHNGIDLSETIIYDDYSNVLNALDTPYNGAQTLKVRGNYFGGLISDYPEIYDVLAEKQALGWTIATSA